ncbi:MAG: YcgN family cysteine cluster protein [Cucumibacter sp.]
MPFWEEKTLEEMTPSEWEALCDGCGRCCLIKLENDETGEVFTSDIHCKLLEPESCLCSDYEHRQAKVPDCIKLDPQNVMTISWIPASCAYRRVAEGKGLAWWHPLVSGDPATVHQAGISVRGRTQSETEVPEKEWEDHIVAWPEEDPEAVEPAPKRKLAGL